MLPSACSNPNSPWAGLKLPEFALSTLLRSRAGLPSGFNSELLLQIVDVARDEHRQPPERLGTAVTGSRLPAMLRRLQNAVAAFVALDGVYPERTGELARRGFGGGMQAITLVGEGIDARDEVQQTMLSVGVRHAGGPNVAPPI